MLLRTIAIVGGGFSGVAVAAQLLRYPPTGPTRLLLIERNEQVGRGVAYADRKFPYLLNVPASRMSASPAEPNQFLEFAQRRIPKATGEDFLPRSLYGEYLQEMLLAAELSAPRHVRFEVLHDEVVNIRRIERHVPFQIELASGVRLTADDAVLALGNPAPTSIGAAHSVLDHPAYLADAWNHDVQFDRSHRVLLIGTGLTAVDVINRASEEPLFTPTLHAISRHGLVPPRQTAFRADAFKGDGNALLLAASRSLRELTSAVRVLAEEAKRCGGDWREAITFVRNTAPTIWQRMPERDRLRFLRHLRAHWDVHRHRLPPQVLQRVDSLRSTGGLHTHAGRIHRMQPQGAQIHVDWSDRRTGEPRAQLFDRVINCTGPDYNITRSKDRLWRNLLQCGLCVPDSCGLGLRTGPNGAVIDAAGWPGPHLFYAGPMLRADYWEATAVGELRTHAQVVAAVLSGNR